MPDPAVSPEVLDRARRKAQYEAARRRAQAVVSGGARWIGGCEVSVRDDASVQLTESGAYVEALIFVPTSPASDRP